MARMGAKGAPLRGAECLVPGYPMGRLTATLGRKRSLDRAIGIAGISARFDRLENRLDGLESRVGILEDRVTGLERRMAGLEKGMDGIARSNHPIETMPAEILTRLSAT